MSSVESPAIHLGKGRRLVKELELVVSQATSLGSFDNPRADVLSHRDWSATTGQEAGALGTTAYPVWKSAALAT